MKRFLVGGAVRDKILGNEVTDFDYVVFDCTEEELLIKGFQLIKKDIKVFLEPKTGDQYAFPRKEIKIGPKYTDFNFVYDQVSLEEDLKRRDFTINAMALMDDGTIVDPFGGQKDLQNRTLRHVSDQFSEDPLRVIRGFRFMSNLDLQIDSKTLELFNQLKSQLKHISNGRMVLELSKVNDLYKFISLLKRYDFLELLFPNSTVRQNQSLSLDTILLYLYSETPMLKKDIFIHYGFNKFLVDKVFLLSNEILGFDLLIKKLKIDLLEENLIIVKSFFEFKGLDTSNLDKMVFKISQIDSKPLQALFSGKTLGEEIIRSKKEIFYQFFK